MPTLFVCHDTGNTEVLLRTADNMLMENPRQEIIFLLVGEASQKIFADPKNATHKDRIILLSDWLQQPDLKGLNNRSLDAQEARTVYDELSKLKPSRAITTCSCWLTARVPFQISGMLTSMLQTEENFLYCGDFFEDIADNPYWVLLESEWITDISILLALAQQQINSLKINSSLHIEVVGSTAIDDVLVPSQIPIQLRQDRLAMLDVNEQQPLLFISGSKNIEDDLKLLEALAESLAANPAAAVRIGVHPGTENIEGHIASIVKWLTEREVAAQIVVSNPVAARISEKSLLDSKYILQADLKGDQVYSVCTSVASAKPATIVSQAALQGKPAYCLEKYRDTSYLQAHLSTSPQALFASRDAKKLSKSDLGLLETPAPKLIGDILLGKPQNRMV
jgi:hypothetical protein